MVDGYFLSYSRVDAADAAQLLADRLVAGPPSYRVWLDARDAQPGRDWDDQIRDAIQDTQAVLFLMTKDSVQDHSVCKNEWVWALQYKKPIIPLKFEHDVRLPFRLSSRQHIDFTQGFDIGLARLRGHLQWLGTPAGVMHELRFRLADAERELPRAQDRGARTRVEQDISDLRAQLAAHEALIAGPRAVVAAANKRITAGLEVERTPARPAEVVARARYVNAAPMTAPSYFQGRQGETELLVEFLRSEDARLATVVGRGGIGKTALVCRVLKGVESGRLPDELGELAVTGIVYLRTPSLHPVNFPNLFTDLCRLLPGEVAERLLARYRDPSESPGGSMAALLDAFPVGPVVVLLDNFEDLLDADTGAIADTALDEALRALLSAPAHGVKVLMTTRVAPGPLLLHEPGAQRRIDLTEGLPSPYAENLLRARDPDGRLGLKTASDGQLALARERTRGYPRALEALAAILSADRNTSLSEVLIQTERLPDNVVQALVGEAFQRLDPWAQQIMQALAVFPVPVPAVAVDYLLQPYQPAVDSAPVLGRLVNMQFARRDAGRYYLHQVDRDYALSLIPEGELDEGSSDAEQGAGTLSFTRHALRERASDYFAQVQIPRAEWKTFDDLGPQLAQFELRYQNGDYDTAGRVLLAITFDYLIRWGHYRYTIELHNRLQGLLTDPWIVAVSHSGLGGCYISLGQFRKGIEHYEQALVIDRDIGDRPGEAGHLASIGDVYTSLGQTSRAVELLEQSLAITRETGDRRGEAGTLGALGTCHIVLGRIPRAVEMNELSLSISREVGYREGERYSIGNLGLCYMALGQIPQAIELFEQSLAIAGELGDRVGEAYALANLGECHADLGAFGQAFESFRHGIEVADAIGNAQMQAEGRLGHAYALLWNGDLPAAAQTVSAARQIQYLPARAAIALVEGIIEVRSGEFGPAARAFHEAIATADEGLRHNPGDVAALDIQGLAYAALSLIEGPEHLEAATAAFRAARARTTAAGMVSRVLRNLDALAPVDPAGILQPLRQAASGDERADSGSS
jgi:tetratricopeptide (TPR) repeat protein